MSELTLYIHQELARRANQGDPQARAYINGNHNPFALMGVDTEFAAAGGRPMRGQGQGCSGSCSQKIDRVQDQLASLQRSMQQAVAGRPITRASNERSLGIGQGISPEAGKGGAIYSEILTLGSYAAGDVVGTVEFPENFRLEGQHLCTWSVAGLDDPSDQAKFVVSFTAGQSGDIIGGQSNVSLRRGASTIFVERTAPMVDPSTGKAPVLGSSIPLIAEVRCVAPYTADTPPAEIFFEVIGGGDCYGFNTHR